MKQKLETYDIKNYQLPLMGSYKGIQNRLHKNNAVAQKLEFGDVNTISLVRDLLENMRPDQSGVFK